MMDIEKKQPKVFISYAWANKELVIKLANRLMSDGINTIIDVWYLKQGNDKYAFMESMVRDKTINHVLIICDKAYKEKADNRTGGVGDETVIISPQLYGEMEQTKFIPIVIEKDEKGNPCKPIYIDSRIHFDFSNDETYEDEYESLLRFLYDEPYYPKPELGKKPEWIKNNNINVSSLTNFVSILKSSNNETRKNAAITEFHQEISRIAKEIIIDVSNRDLEFLGNELTEKISAMKPLRDVFLDFLKELILSEKEISEFLTTCFEKIYNELMTLPPNVSSYYDSSYEHYKFFIWELFICSIAYLRYYEKYNEIAKVLKHTYYLKNELTKSKQISPSNFLRFRFPLDTLESYGKKKKNYYSYASEIAVHRIKEPIITKENFAETDIFISQMSFALNIQRNDFYWFAYSYIYSQNPDNIWIRLSSRSYCEKLFPLFGVKTLEELKEIIKKTKVPSEYRYNSAWSKIPDIPFIIRNYEIGSLE